MPKGLISFGPRLSLDPRYGDETSLAGLDARLTRRHPD